MDRYSPPVKVPTAACYKIVSIVRHVAATISGTCSLHAKIGQVVEADPAFTSWSELQPMLIKEHFSLTAWCNDMRRRRLEDLDDFWTAKQREVFEKLVLNILNLVDTTDQALDVVLGRQDPQTDIQPSSWQQACGDLTAFALLQELAHSMGSVHKVIVKHHPEAAHWQERQPFLFHAAEERSFQVMWLMAELAMKDFIELGRTEWEAVLDRYYIWGNGHFTGEMTLDSFLSEPIMSGLRAKVAEGFGKIIFHLVDAAEDLLRTEQLSEAHIVVLKNVCVHLNQVLDTQMLFIDNMSLWFNTNVHRFMSHSAVARSIVGEPTKPIDGVLTGIRDLWRTEAAMQEGQEHIRAIN